MAQMTGAEKMEKLVALCKRRGFIFQSSEIYGGLNGAWDFGPLGAELKRNVKDYWWRCNVQMRDDMVGIDGAILTHQEVLKASGHVGGFSDPMSTCKACKKLVRADQVKEMVATSPWAQSIAELIPVEFTAGPDGTQHEHHRIEGEKLMRWARGKGKSLAPNLALVRNPEVVLSWLAEEAETEGFIKDAWHFYQLLATEQLKQTGLITPCPHCGGELTEPREFNLMFETHMGAARDESSIAYLRPETAQTIFVQFKNVLETSRQKLPFGIAQMGKSFRNEINPRNYIFRSREFEQMEIEFFVKPDQGLEWTDKWLEARLSWYESVGIPRAKIHILDVPEADRAFYSQKTYDLEYEFPFGVQELEGIAYRGDYDLTQHIKGSGKPLDYFDEETKEKFVPHVVEPSAGVDRTVLALLCEAFDEEVLTDDKGKEDVRTVLRFVPRMAPIKTGVFPLLKNKPELVAKAKEVAGLLRPHMAIFYDEAGAIGRRYRRMDEVGTPFGVTVDFETLEGTKEEADGIPAGTTGTVTLRHRDSMKQERIAIDKLLGYLLGKIA